MANERVKQQVEQWAKELIDLTRRNRSVFYRPLKRGTVEFAYPAPAPLFAALMGGGGLPLYVPPPPRDDADWTVDDCIREAKSGQLVTNRTTAADVVASLKALHRQAGTDLMDRGVQTLYVCFGMLHWTETERGEDVRSPLVFVPVVLERVGASERFTLERSDEDVVLNPSLQVLMEDQFDLTFGTAASDLQDAEDLGAVLDGVRDRVRSRGWTVEPTATLLRATFHKEAMYRDLLDNIDVIAAHETVASLAGVDETSTEGAAIPSEGEVDAAAPPENAHLIMDADASQRRAIEAARRGASFVMDGPPGTGKSQTISNMIAELLAAGRSVLFVSEKAAALEVVANRLANRGLDEFLLELHSHKVSRQHVVSALARALKTHPEARPKLSDPERDAARRARELLTSYADAVNEVRKPLGRSINWVAGRLALLADLPKAPTPRGVTADLRSEDVMSLLEQFEFLSSVWAPVEDPGFAWRGLAARSFSPVDAAQLGRDLDQLRLHIESASELGGELAFAIGTSQPATFRDIARSLGAANHLRQQPTTQPGWWTTSTAPLRERIAKLAAASDLRHRAADRLATVYGANWEALPLDGQARLQAAEQGLSALAAPVTLPAAISAAWAAEARDALSGLADTIAQVDGDVGSVSGALGVPHRSRTAPEVLDLAAVAQRADATVRPDPAWAVPVVMEQVRAAVQVLEPVAKSFADRHAQLDGMFAEAVYDLDLETLTTRIEQGSGLKKLGKIYRSAKREIAAATRTGKANREVLDAVPLARDAQRARRQLDTLEATHRELLGSHYRSRATDTTAVGEALSILNFALDKLGDEYAPEPVAANLAGHAPQDGLLAQRGRAIAGRLTDSIARVTDHVPGIDDVLAHVPLSALAASARSASEFLDGLHRLLSDVLPSGVDVGDLDTLRKELAARHHVGRLDADLYHAEEADRAAFGPWYAGFDTDFTGLTEAVAWVERLHELLGGPTDARTAERLHGRPAPGAASLSEAVSAASTGIAALYGAFDEPERAAHEAIFVGPLDAALDHLAELHERIGEPAIWVDHRRAREELVELGWADTLDFCVQQAVASDALPSVLEHALYAAWFEGVLEDPRLATLRGADRDALVAAFAKQDRALLTDAAESVVMRCNARRPRVNIGAVGIIKKEAEKKRRHMPVRKLLAETVEVATDLKPCFMMSPLSVSQFLPADYRFDVVIFDEASQIRPADAINCIYRGHQLVVAGDDKQLPPTSFFDSGGGDDDVYDEEAFDEFESVLSLAKASQAMHSLPLRWHYRSQHESLITFSNYEFYEGDLVTYPGADEFRPDLGVELIVVDGQYRRGGRRDNPVEAEAVAQRVLFHARTHPELSLGVVAFSQAQAEAVDDAMDRLRQANPDIEPFFEESRLDGFFVKNLENVQGDERDIIIFTVGYGPDEAGKFTLNFGPVNREGGWRRLNVAVTRAKRRVEVISSFRPGEMDTRGSTNRGVLALQKYLDYADRGAPALAIDLSHSVGDVESPLEASILQTVRSWGYDVAPQVGTAGYRVDLGIRDPAAPGRFMLGIEADGAAYHSSKVARDRDRLRQQVLESLGWTLHRVWGPSWYRDRANEEQRLRQAISAASAGRAPEPIITVPEVVDRVSVDVDFDDHPSWTTSYETASITVRRAGRSYDPENRELLKSAIKQVVEVEAPVHLDIIGRRVADHFDHNLTKKARDAVRSAVKELARTSWQGELTSDDFVWLGDGFDVRVPSDDEQTRRAIEHIAPEELQEGVHLLLTDARVCSEDELLVAVRDLFGFKRMGPKIAEALDTALASLLSRKLVERADDGRLRAMDGEGAPVKAADLLGSWFDRSGG